MQTNVEDVAVYMKHLALGPGVTTGGSGSGRSGGSGGSGVFSNKRIPTSSFQLPDCPADAMLAWDCVFKGSNGYRSGSNGDGNGNGNGDEHESGSSNGSRGGDKDDNGDGSLDAPTNEAYFTKLESIKNAVPGFSSDSFSHSLRPLQPGNTPKVAQDLCHDSLAKIELGLMEDRIEEEKDDVKVGIKRKPGNSEKPGKPDFLNTLETLGDHDSDFGKGNRGSDYFTGTGSSSGSSSGRGSVDAVASSRSSSNSDFGRSSGSINGSMIGRNSGSNCNIGDRIAHSTESWVTLGDLLSSDNVTLQDIQMVDEMDLSDAVDFSDTENFRSCTPDKSFVHGSTAPTNTGDNLVLAQY